jgi:hypothetical protein
VVTEVASDDVRVATLSDSSPCSDTLFDIGLEASMKIIEDTLRSVLLSAAIALPLAGCGSDDKTNDNTSVAATHEVFFNGYAYDGALGTRLQGYTLEVQYRDQVVPGVVSADGRYLVGPIPVFQDYTVTIAAGGYRTFRSHNAGFSIPGPDTLAGTNANTSQTHFFDAYLFPATLQSADINLAIKQLTTTGAPVAAGKVRLRAGSASVLADSAAETPSGVLGQLWTNDEDLQAKPVIKDIAGGKVTITGAEVVYGVTYLVSIYEVPGFQPFESTVTAGRDGIKTFALSEETGEPLLLVSNTVSNCHPPLTPLDGQSAVVTFDFNQDIELSASTLPGGNAELIDSGMSMVSADTDIDLMRNTLRTNASSTVQERGTSVATAGKTLTLSWNPSIGLLTNDPQDVISQVSYSGLTSLFVQPVGKPGSKVSIGAVYGSQVTCF